MFLEKFTPLAKNFTPPDFQAKDFTPLISLNFNSFSEKKTQKMSVFGEIYTSGKKIYTAGGSDGSDKSHLCRHPRSPSHLCQDQD